MALYQGRSEVAAALEGLHLFQFVTSNCSQRVRIALEEKELAWTAHNLDGARWQQMQPDYGAINPNRVVPTLVHDGRVYTESNDIIEYLDDTFTQPNLRPQDSAARNRLRAIQDDSGAFQWVIKTLSHDILFRATRNVTAEDIAMFERLELEPERVAFYRDFSENGTAWAARVDDGKNAAQVALEKLETILEKDSWLGGHTFGLADIAWIVNVARLQLVKFPLEDFPRVLKWATRVKARPSYHRAVTSYSG